MKTLKKSFLLLLAVVFMASCANTRGVGNTKQAAKASRYNSNRVGTQFIGVR